MTFNAPLFVLTSDVDWASDPCIDDLASEAAARGIRPVFMATGASAALTRLAEHGLAQIGLHPNFSPGSSHGPDLASVVDHITRLYLLQRESPVTRPRFLCADAVAHISGVPDASVDAVITERFLLNLPDAHTQRLVIRESWRALRPGGHLVMCEGSLEGFRGLNQIRASVGLPEIEERSGENMSAIRFEDAELEAFCAGLGLRLVDKAGFRDYFILSRVLHPLLVAPQPPRFGARLNDLAGQIQRCLPMTPGVGSNVVWVFRKSRPTP